MEDSLLDAQLIGETLRDAEIHAEIERVESSDDFARALTNHIDLILADYSLPAFDGLTALRIAQATRPEIPFILVSGQLGEERAVEALKGGATDFVLKQGLARLAPSVRRALREAHERRELAKAVLALRESEERYRFLADAIPQMAWTADATGRTDYVNQRWIEYAGVSGEQLVDTGWQILLHPDDHERYAKAWRQATESGANYEIECRIRRGSDGAYRWHLARAAPMRDRDGRMIKWFGTCTDVDEQKRTAEALERNQARLRRAVGELARSNQELQQFGSIIAHDLRQPLQSIILYLRVLERACKAKVLAEIDELVGSIVQVVNRMSDLMTDTLEYSRVGGSELALESVELEAAIRAAEANLTAVIGDTQAVVEIGEMPAVRGHQALLAQLFQNLIENAIKYRSGDTPQIRISCRETEDGWQVEVADNGIGIEPGDSERLFQIFQRPAKHSEFPGTGVGLSICKRIVERHGGRIWFTRSPGAGTVFHFTLAFNPPEAAPAESSA